MASKSLTFDIYGKDKSASKTIRGVGNAADSTGKRFKASSALMVTALAAVTAGVISFGVDSIKAYADAEDQQNKLAFAFEKFPALADTNQKSLQKLNTELQKKTRFDDDALAAAQANLAQYGLTGAQLKEITPLLADYAAKTGKDVVTASGDLGKALLGQGRALKGVGVDFTDTGTVAGNFTEIMDTVGAKVGGFAEKDADTASGRLEKLQHKFGELQESVGEKLLTPLSNVMDELDKSGTIDDMTSSLGDLVTTLGDIAVGFQEVEKNTGWLKTIGNIWQTGGDAIGNIGGFFDDKAIDKISKGAQDRGGPLGDLFKWTEDWDKGWVEFWGGASTEAETGMGKIRGGMGGGFSALGFDTDAYKAKFGTQWSDTWGNGETLTTDGWSNINAKALGGVGNVSGTMGTVSPAVRSAFSDAGAWLTTAGSNIVMGLTNGIASVASSAVRAAVTVAKNLLQGVKDALGIRSPSKEFEWVGMQIGAGLVKGIDGSASAVDAAVTGLVSVPSGGSASVPVGASSGSPGGCERPIYADGIGLIGWMREIANGEAQIVWAAGDKSRQSAATRGFAGV